MGVSKRTVYVISCDGPGCHHSEVADWRTRLAATEAALEMGWVKAGRYRMLCPKCRDEASRIRSRVLGGLVSKMEAERLGAVATRTQG